MSARHTAPCLFLLAVFTAAPPYAQEQIAAPAIEPAVPAWQPELSGPPGSPVDIQSLPGDPETPAPAGTTPVFSEPVPVTASAPIIRAAQQPVDREERTRSMVILITAGVLIVTLGALIVLLIKRGRLYKKAGEATVSEAFLYDLNGRTATPAYKLGKKPIMFGRVAGKDTEHLDYIVIPESTIGRRHATIEYKDYAYWIMDQGSINGTFVNDVRVTSETRLKHGDRIRLHKIEFDFVMPDLEEAGMTRIAEPAAAVAADEIGLDAEAIKSGLGGGMDLDLGFDEAPAPLPSGSEETLLPGFGGAPAAHPGPDATLIPDPGPAGTPAPTGKHRPRDDETLIPDSFNGITDNATLLPTSDEADEIFDVTGADGKHR